MAGRKPIPVAVLDNKTNRLTKAELDARADNEPKGASAELKPPRTLSRDARKEWNRIVKLYRQLDAEIINDMDMGILACYCESVAVFQNAQKHYLEEPLTYIDKKGERRENPWVKIMDREGLNIAKYGEQLCLTPVGRARMGIAKAKKEIEADPMAALLQRGKYG